MKALLRVVVAFGIGAVVGMAAVTRHGTEATAAAMPDDAAVRVAYAFAMAPSCQETLDNSDSFVALPEPVVEKPKPPAKPQSFKTVCSCGRTLDCTCAVGQCDCEACKPATIQKCECSGQCTCGCENGKECRCRQENRTRFSYAPSVFQYSAPPRLTGCAGGR